MAWTISARPRTAALAVAAGLLLATGCTGSDDAATSPTTAPTAAASPTAEATDSPTTETPEPTETSALPPLPDAATENTPEGAEAFIRYYFDVVNLGYTTPQPGLASQLSDSECLACQGIEEQIQGLTDARQRVRIPPFDVQEVALAGGGAPGVTSFNVSLVQPANQFVAEDGGVVRESPEVQKSGVVAAIWEGQGWLLYDSAVE
jgi:hypothetical protein